MKIIDDFIPVNPFSRPGQLLLDVRAIVIHWVGNARKTAKAVKAYFEGLKTQNPDDAIEDFYASTQYAINNSDIIRMMPENEVAYHVGAKTWEYTPRAKSLCGGFGVSNAKLYGSTPNWYTIGIELNHIDWDGRLSEETYISAVELTADLCKRYKLDPKIYVLRHYDVTGKVCPKWFVFHEKDWNCFLGDVSEAMEL